MAREIQTGDSFAKLPLIPQLGRDEEPDEDDLPRTSIPVIHNYQHDLESLWWIIFFIGAFYTGHKPSITFCHKIFVPYIVTDCGATRNTIFTRGFAATSGFKDSLHPDLRETLFRYLDISRYTFYSRARNREASALQDPASYSFVCITLLGLFGKSTVAKDTWGSIPLVRPETTLATPTIEVVQVERLNAPHAKTSDGPATPIQEELQGTKRSFSGNIDDVPAITNTINGEVGSRATKRSRHNIVS